MMRRKSGRYLVVGVAAVLLIVAALLGFRNLGLRSADSDHHHGGRDDVFADRLSVRERERVKLEKSRFFAQPTPVPPGAELPEAAPKFRNGGSGTEGAIRDQEGRLIWRATLENPVYAISVSPGENLIAVEAGNGIAYIISSAGEKIMDLPQFPPGIGMIGLANWTWLDDHRILGQSGIGMKEESETESRYFIYDLKDRRLSEMHLPDSIVGKVVHVTRVLKTGEFSLSRGEDHPEWYKAVDVGKGQSGN